MYFNYIFLLTDFYQNGYLPAVGDNGAVSLPINKALWENKRQYLHQLYTAAVPFCFAALDGLQQLKKTEWDHVQNDLSSFFFLPSYMKSSGAYLLITDAAFSNSKMAHVDLDVLLGRQGITPLAKNNMCPATQEAPDDANADCYYSTALINALPSATPAHFQQAFRTLVSQQAVSKHLIIPVTGADDYETKRQALQQFEQWIAENETAYLNLLTSFQLVNQQYQHLQTENNKLKFRIHNYNDYLKLLKETALLHEEAYNKVRVEKELLLQNGNRVNTIAHESTSPIAAPYNAQEMINELNFIRNNRTEILEWYSKEYEVLPLWYKRFGHIIKIMIGKRKIKDYLK